MMRAIAGVAFIAPGEINVSNVSRSGLSLAGQLWLDAATMHRYQLGIVRAGSSVQTQAWCGFWLDGSVSSST